MAKEVFDICKIRKTYSEIELSKLWVDFYAGDMKAREKIIVGNLSLITFVINKIIKNFSRIDFEDLFSIGEIGLMNAVDNFDISVGVKFSGYACTCIRNEIVNFLRNGSNFEALTLQSDYEYEYDHCIGYDSSNFLEFIEDSINIQDLYDDKELLIRFYELFDLLDDNCKMAMRLHYGFCGNREHTIDEVAKEMNLSYNQVRTLINKSRRILRRLLEEEGYSEGFSTDIRKYRKKYF